jgi:hypothetical protein
LNIHLKYKLDMDNLSNMKFRRQFLFSAHITTKLEGWQYENLGEGHLYVHPDCELVGVRGTDKELFLIGYAINPYFPEKTSKEVLEDISKFESIEEIPKLIYSLGGRFVLMIKFNGKFTFFHDACGLRQIVYTKHQGKLYAASQPLLLKEVLSLEKSPDYEAYFTSRYVKNSVEHYLPGGVSLYEGVFQLVPNHYIDSSDFIQIRYWPNSKTKELSVNEAVKKISPLLKNSISAAINRYKMALSLTGGRDTRIMLGACREYIDKLFVYTLQYRNLTMLSNDLRIPQNLASRLGFQHHIIDCRKPLTAEFAEVYMKNTDLAHLKDWGEIAHGMLKEYPPDRVSIKGSCTEIGRCSFYKLGKHTKITSGDRFFGIPSISAWSEIDFIKTRVIDWYEKAKNCEEIFGYDLFDLFYWEHRMGSWQAQNQLEWDIVQEVFTPYNNREIIDTMLQVNARFRSVPELLFFNTLIFDLWEDLLAEPINPTSYFRKLKKNVKNVLRYYEIKYYKWI